MGMYLSRTMEDSLKQHQETVLEMQRIQLERQIHMQNQMRARMAALQVAKARELLYWYGSFYAVSSVAMLVGYKKSKHMATLVPFLPFTFVLAYQADLAYGSKLIRIKGEAENILSYEEALVELPLGVPSVGSIDEARERVHDEESFSKAHDIFL